MWLSQKGRSAIIECSTFLGDNLLEGIDEIDQIKYPVNTCYSRYVQQKKRIKNKAVDEEPGPSSITDSQENEQSAPETIEARSSKRLKLDLTVAESSSAVKEIKNKDRLCIVCNQKKSKGDYKKCRICEARRAQLFLSAINFFKDAIYNRFIYLKSIGDVYAADIY